MVGLLVATWEPWERITQVELGVNTLVGESMELALVSLKLSDEVHEVLRLRKSIEVLCVDHIPEFVLDLDSKLNDIERVKSVITKVGLEGDLCLLGGAEVVLDDADDILFNLVVVLEDQGVFLRLCFFLP